MRKLCLILAAAVLMSALCGCNILETKNPPTLPKIDLDESILTCRVDFINGRTCRVTVTEGDSHYDGPHENRRGEMVEGDTLQISYTSLKGADTVSVGDTITFSYHYNTDVSEKNGDPHISVSEITVSK